MKRSTLKAGQLLAAMIGLLGLSASAQTTSFTYSGAITSYVVPAGVTNITITTRGAQGGNETMGSTSGGQGAIMTGNFVVTPGQTLKVLTGGQGVTAMYVGGGGGGSFVWDQTTSTLMSAAGGGGGAGWDDVTSSGSTGTNATTTATANNGYTMTSGAGTGGNGGVIPTGYAGYAGGGAGWLSNGNNGTIHGCTFNSTGGIRPLVSGAGGTGGGYVGTAANGGFGGGGGGNARCGAVGGGGGGGYSGGGAGGEITLALTYRAGGGGGSYNSGTSPVNSIGNTGNGLVIISVACTPPAPITGTPTVCVTGTTTLASTTSGGTWSSSSGGIATVGLSSGVVTGIAPGTATITYSASGACFVTAVVTVNAAPTGGTITGTATVCSGLTTALSDPTATPGGTWSSSDITKATVSGTGVVTGVAPGTATITYSVTTTCGTATATRVVTVNVSPAAITGPLAMCAGSTGTLSSSTPGGVWSSVTTSVATITSSGGVVSAIAVGTSTISYLVGSCPAVAVVTVTTAPGPITGPATVCQGATIVLGNSVPGGTWTSGFTPVATVGLTTGVVTGVSVGGAPITYAVGTCTVTTTIGVNPNPAPIDPATPIAICVGATAVVSDVTGGGTWSSTTGAATISSGGLITGVAAGVTTISYTYAGCAATKNVTINPNPPAIGGSLNVCTAATTILTSTMPGGTWTVSPTSVATIGSSTGAITGVSAGTATVTYTISATGCYTTAAVAVGAAPAAITGPNALCAGGATITLANTVAGGAWSSGSTATATVGTSGVVSSGTPGTVTISYTTPGCTPAMYLVTVNALPSPIGGMLGVCNGVPSSLYDATPGGSWSSSDVTIATVSSSGVLSGLLPGTAIITYAMPGGCFITGLATVNPTAPILGPDDICAGGTGYLTNIVGGGTWTSSNPAVSDVGLITGVMTTYVPGPTYIQYTMPTGCSVTKLINVIPQILPISGPDRVCTGSVNTLGDASTGGTWTSSNLYAATVGDTTGVLIAGHPGEVDITYTMPGVGCMSVKTITVDPLPVPVITYSGNTTHTLSTSPYYTSYQWFDSSSGFIPGANTMTLVINPGTSESYYVLVTDNNGCTGANVYDYVTHAGVGSVTAGDITIYPNPATDRVIITAPVSVRAVVTDVTGRKGIEQDNAKEVNVSTLAPGVYIITLYNRDGVVIAKEKLVKH